jgi:hypothetical protein
MQTHLYSLRCALALVAAGLLFPEASALAKSKSSVTTDTGGTGTTDYSSGRIGMLAVSNDIVMNNAKIDSYDATRGPWNSTTNRGDDVVVATRSSGSKVKFQNADIYGEIAVGAATAASGVSYTQGTLTNADSAGGTKVDAALIHTGVTLDAPATPVAPTNTGDTLGFVLPQNVNNSMTMGVSGASSPSYYYTPSGANLSLSGSKNFTVVGPTVLVVKGTLDLSGAGGITVEEGAWIAIYVTGNIKINGNNSAGGLDNHNDSGNHAIIYGIGGAGQNLTVDGGSLTAAFYGPGYNVNVNGSGDWSGSIVAAYINYSGSGGFHYDSTIVTLDPVSPAAGITETTTDTSTGTATTVKTTYGVSGWKELGSRTGSAYSRDTDPPFNQ